jgi:hypothetical protein
LRRWRRSLPSGAPGEARAIPVLQLYIEGSTYDATTETWTVVGDQFRLWVLGNVGSFGTISDVRLTAAFADGLSGTLTITPDLADPALLPFPGDPSRPGDVSLVGNPLSALSPATPCGTNGTVGTIPCMSDEVSKLPNHGEFGSGIQWREWSLGDMTLTDSPIGDFILSFPTEFPSTGQINAYLISVSGFPAGTLIHFDAFNHVQSGNKTRTVFAPFSHDAEGRVPAPPALVLFVAVFGGALALAGARRLRPGRRGGSAPR